ncbi:hypothetical protein Dsin_003763 [Dipteronia sinensis]|uniref:HTH La-type RNA-binding domain-containing protein n=1 Tax=Dipteronia sinensis TaxID=43782 RepID=A0AAE0B9R5_9ROSI|nr:hypothetical protein Dsin_003763 [Dipteronia sinensis]
MAMTADSASNHHSPRGSGFSSSSGGGGDGLSSPQFRRISLPSPWAQVVRGEAESVSSAVNHSPSSSPPLPQPLTSSLPEPAAADSSSPSKAASASSSPPPPPPEDISSVVAESSDATNGNAASRPKKVAWNKPSNGVVEVGPVMGAVSWPALSESTKPSPKSSPSVDSPSASKAVPDGSVANNQVPVVSHVPQKQSTANVNPNSNPNRTMPARQKPKRSGGGSSSGIGNAGGGGGGPGQSGFTRPSQPPPPPPPPFPLFTVAPNSFGNLVPALPDHSPREPPYRGNNWESRPVGGFVPQSHPASEHRNSSRRGNYGPRGDGQYHNNFGGRRDQDRANYANARDVHVQPQRGPPRGFVRPPPPNAATFVPPPQPMRPFANPMGYPEFIYLPPMPMESFRGMPGGPFMPPGPPATVFVPVPEPPLSLPVLLINQIDYYFSDANLIKDEYLKSNMDEQGWVPIALIAGFPRVKNLTTNIQLILDSLRTSTVVEVQDDKVRRRSEWMKWIPIASRVATDSGLASSGGSSQDLLTTSFQKMAVEEGTHQGSTTGQSQLPNGEGTEDI